MRNPDLFIFGANFIFLQVHKWEISYLSDLCPPLSSPEPSDPQGRFRHGSYRRRLTGPSGGGHPRRPSVPAPPAAAVPVPISCTSSCSHLLLVQILEPLPRRSFLWSPSSPPFRPCATTVPVPHPCTSREEHLFTRTAVASPSLSTGAYCGSVSFNFHLHNPVSLYWSDIKPCTLGSDATLFTWN